MILEGEGWVERDDTTQNNKEETNDKQRPHLHTGEAIEEDERAEQQFYTNQARPKCQAETYIHQYSLSTDAILRV